MKKILVTGGNGFLGSRICRYLRERGYEVYAPTHQQMEVTKWESAKQYLQACQPEIVIHCAAISDTGYAQEHPKESFLVNVVGTEYLAKLTAEMGIRFLFMSSDQIYNGRSLQKAVYDKTNDASREETDDCPVNVYGQHKKEAEERSLRANPNTVALRLTWMYDLPREGLKKNRNLLTNLLEAEKEHKSLSFARHEYRGITNVWEVVVNLERVFEIPAGIYNYGSENSFSTIEIAKEAAKRLALKEQVIEEDTKRFADCPRNLTMCCEKAGKEGIFFKDTMEGLKHFRCTPLAGMVQ